MRAVEELPDRPLAQVFSAGCGGEEEIRKGLKYSYVPWQRVMTGIHAPDVSVPKASCPP